jgi:hypothetical protein
MKLRPILLRTLCYARWEHARREQDVRTRPLVLAVLGATGRLGLRDLRWQERGRGLLERRRGYRYRIDLLFVVEVCRVRRDRALKVDGIYFS